MDLEYYVRRAGTLEGWVLEFEPDYLGPELPWKYEQRAKELAAQAHDLVDLGTGGGEVLSRILEGVSARAYAVEEWQVNAPVAHRALAHRATVLRASSERLPFRDHSFDLVLSRHEAIDPAEIARVLAPGGRFLTQQVVPEHLCELQQIFPEITRYPDHFNEYQEGLRIAGLRIDDARICFTKVRFRELGHLVYHLTIAPWLLPHFTVESCRPQLEDLERQLREQGGLTFTSGNYIIEASRSR